MKYFTTIVLIACSIFIGRSQTYEVGAIVGGTNFIGDVGRTSYIAPSRAAYGGIFKWNRSARHSFRATLMQANLIGEDIESSDPRRQQRGLSFENTVTEISIGLEYTFWDFNLYSGQPQGTPYLYTGLTAFQYKALRKLPGETAIEDYDSAWSPAIPIVFGYKTTLAGKFVLGLEIGARYTFTDGLDGSNPVNGLADVQRFKFGNINSDDWYVFTGVTLTYMFGRKPCYCNF